jgi:hypothetical protein
MAGRLEAGLLAGGTANQVYIDVMARRSMRWIDFSTIRIVPTHRGSPASRVGDARDARWTTRADDRCLLFALLSTPF